MPSPSTRRSHPTCPLPADSPRLTTHLDIHEHTLMKSLAFLLFLSPVAFAATNFVLPGNSETGVWNLNVDNYNNSTAPGYPASGGANNSSLAWGGPIASTSTSATFTKVSGPGYFISSGSGIYGTTVANTYAVEDLAPIADLSNLIFQSRTNNPGFMGGAAGGGYGSVLLYLNGSGVSIAPTFSYSSAASASTSDFAWQWDLSSYGQIDSYRIVIEANPHAVVYGNAADLTRISASDTFVQVIPEPSSLFLGCAALGLTAIRRRRA